MKVSRAGRLLAMVSTALILLLVSSVPAGAAGSDTPSVWPPPITDPAKAVPFSHPETNTVNPKSPLYDPNGLYGTPGSRFGPPGQKSESLPIPEGITEEGHRSFGTIISTTSVDYTYAHHLYISNLSIPSGTTLYAPTMLGSNDSPLEIVTRYWWSNNTLKREIAVYDHAGSGFVVSTSAVSDYLYGSGYYVAEILLYSGSWYAMIYNFSTQQWETWYSRQGGSGPEPYGRGWDVWEEYDFNESTWPDISAITLAKELYIYVQGSGGTYVTSSHGFEQKDVGSAPYVFGWISNYYYWWVNMDY